MNNLTLIYFNSSVVELKEQIEKKLETIKIDLVKASLEECKHVQNKASLLFLNELIYPEQKELPIIFVLEMDGKKLCLVGKVEQEILTILQTADYRQSLGKVYLVGAGQSSRELLTLKALQLMQKADIVFYDSLIDKDILKETKAKCVFVGKRAGAHHKDQDDINLLLLKAAKEYKNIVRIKGGDPMIFGHAGEEIAFLEQEFVDVEVVPGITSALGAAAVSNTPLTLRNVSNSVAYCTAHQKSQIPVPDTDTIVYFMGAGNMKNVAKALLKGGRSGSTPVKLVYNIGAADQEIYNESVGSLLEKGKTFKAPLISIVGKVANKSNWHKAFEHQPKILFTGTNLSKYVHLGYVLHHPMIELVPLSDFTDVDKAIKEMGTYNWLVFTSAYSVKFFFKRLFETGKDSRCLNVVKIASIGRFTSEKLKNVGIIPELQATNESSEGLISLFKKKEITSQSILIPRSNLAHNTLPEGLKEIGNQVNTLIVYNNSKPVIESKIDPESFDQIIFTSPSGVKNFIETYGILPESPKLISKGKETEKALTHYRLK